MRRNVSKSQNERELFAVRELVASSSAGRRLAVYFQNGQLQRRLAILISSSQNPLVPRIAVVMFV